MKIKCITCKEPMYGDVKMHCGNPECVMYDKEFDVPEGGEVKEDIFEVFDRMFK